MSFSGATRSYWDDKSGQTDFTHPLELDWLASLPKAARILDYGCGYGRVLAEVVRAGWSAAIGVDLSAGMIARGRGEHPDLDLRCIDGLPLAFEDGAFDAVLLFAVLTTMPADKDQDAVMAEMRRLLRPSGLLYVSDYPLQTDERYLGRYAAGVARHGVYGVWDRDDGGAFRHHGRERFAALLAGFEVLAESEQPTRTLSGAPALAIQMLARRLPA